MADWRTHCGDVREPRLLQFGETRTHYMPTYAILLTVRLLHCGVIDTFPDLSQ